MASDQGLEFKDFQSVPGIFVIGNVSEPYQLGSILARAIKQLGLYCIQIDTNLKQYAPSMKVLWGRAFFKIAGKRPLEWWAFNADLAQKIQTLRPKLILVTGIIPLSPSIFSLCQDLQVITVNYLTDYPWNPRHRSPHFLENLQRYDWAFSTKSTIIQELYGFGVKRAEYLPFAYDPSIHHLPEVINTETDHRFESDIAFVGTGDRERIHYFQELLKINGVKLKVYGPQWENMELPKSALDLPVFGHDLSLAIYLAKLSIGLVRKHNRDQSTMRTFEIAACGGCGIYEDTQEHREILNGYPDYGFFSSPSDLAEKCEWLLKHPVEREAMRQLGIRKVISESANTYLDRLKTILDLVTL